MMDHIYKLTDADMRTQGGCQWQLGKWKRKSGRLAKSAMPLCSHGWFHCYGHPLVAVFMHPVHVRFPASTMRLFVGRGSGASLDDQGLKRGYKNMILTPSCRCLGRRLRTTWRSASSARWRSATIRNSASGRPAGCPERTGATTRRR